MTEIKNPNVNSENDGTLSDSEIEKVSGGGIFDVNVDVTTHVTTHVTTPVRDITIDIGSCGDISLKDVK